MGGGPRRDAVALWAVDRKGPSPKALAQSPRPNPSTNGIAKVLEWSPTVLRTSGDDKGRGFDVRFKGEEGQDWGGVYRSTIDDLAQENQPLATPTC